MLKFIDDILDALGINFRQTLMSFLELLLSWILGDSSDFSQDKFAPNSTFFKALLGGDNRYKMTYQTIQKMALYILGIIVALELLNIFFSTVIETKNNLISLVFCSIFAVGVIYLSIPFANLIMNAGGDLWTYAMQRADFITDKGSGQGMFGTIEDRLAEAGYGDIPSEDVLPTDVMKYFELLYAQGKIPTSDPSKLDSSEAQQIMAEHKALCEKRDKALAYKASLEADQKEEEYYDEIRDGGKNDYGFISNFVVKAVVKGYNSVRKKITGDTYWDAQAKKQFKDATGKDIEDLVDIDDSSKWSDTATLLAAENIPVVGSVLVLLEDILLLVFGWHFLKVAVEIIQRYISLAVLVLFAPLSGALLASDKTRKSFQTYWQMLFIDMLLLILNRFWLFFIVYAGKNVKVDLMTVFILIALCRVGESLNNYVKSLGLSSSQMSGSLMGSVTAGVGGLLAGVSLAGRGIKNAGTLAANTGALTGNTKMARMGNFLAGKGISDAAVAKTMTDSTGGYLRKEAGLRNQDKSNLTNSIKAQSMKLAGLGGLANREILDRSISSLNSAGKAAMYEAFSNSPDSPFSALKAKYEGRGQKFAITDYDARNGFSYSVTDATSGELVRTGTISDISHSGDDSFVTPSGNTMYEHFDNVSAPIGKTYTFGDDGSSIGEDGVPSNANKGIDLNDKVAIQNEVGKYHTDTGIDIAPAIDGISGANISGNLTSAITRADGSTDLYMDVTDGSGNVLESNRRMASISSDGSISWAGYASADDMYNGRSASDVWSEELQHEGFGRATDFAFASDNPFVHSFGQAMFTDEHGNNKVVEVVTAENDNFVNLKNDRNYSYHDGNAQIGSYYTRTYDAKVKDGDGEKDNKNVLTNDQKETYRKNRQKKFAESEKAKKKKKGDKGEG